MFKYTASKALLREMQVAKKNNKTLDARYHKRQELLQRYLLQEDRTLLLALHFVLEVHYPNTCFYSPVKVPFILINGYKFPSEIFDVQYVA